MGECEMNWKYEAVDKLKGYEAHRVALGTIPEEIRRLEDDAARIKAADMDREPVSGGESGREDMLLSNIVHREELGRALKQARAWVRIVDKGLAVLDQDERLVLDRFYIHRAAGNVDRLCEELAVEKATVYRRRDAALRRFTIALYGCVES